MYRRPAPAEIAEHDRMRSEHIRDLLQSDCSAPSSGDVERSIPRTLVQFWDTRGAIPNDVQECLDSWRPILGEGITRRLFSDETAREFIQHQMGPGYATAFDYCDHPAMRCDYFRLCYLFRYGGFYVDADEVYQGGDVCRLLMDARLKVQPLCYDKLNDTMVPREAFLSGPPSAAWIYYVNNNPLLAPARHPVIRLALERSTRLLLDRPESRGDIQATTGPGNLTASLVRHSVVLRREGGRQDFQFLWNWDAISVSRWSLSYRSDERNWRLWSKGD